MGFSARPLGGGVCWQVPRTQPLPKGHGCEVQLREQVRSRVQLGNEERARRVGAPGSACPPTLFLSSSPAGGPEARASAKGRACEVQLREQVRSQVQLGNEGS